MIVEGNCTNPMTSEAKIAANRRNAQRSTGPRTAPAKARVRRNALRHGLAALVVGDQAVATEVGRVAAAICGPGRDALGPRTVADRRRGPSHPETGPQSAGPDHGADVAGARPARARHREWMRPTAEARAIRAPRSLATEAGGAAYTDPLSA